MFRWLLFDSWFGFWRRREARIVAERAAELKEEAAQRAAWRAMYARHSDERIAIDKCRADWRVYSAVPAAPEAAALLVCAAILRRMEANTRGNGLIPGGAVHSAVLDARRALAALDSVTPQPPLAAPAQEAP